MIKALQKKFTSIKQRCTNPKTPAYKDYGGRGIKCEWANSKKFIQDMGESFFAGATIDRIDPNGNYSKENCRWATRKEQARNTRRSIFVTLNGKKILAVEHAEILGIDFGTYRSRLKEGYTAEEIATTPIKNNAGILIEYNGVKRTITQWEKCLGFNEGTIKARLRKYNWSIEKALSTKPITNHKL